MNRLRRNLKLRPELESMDARIVPSAMGLAQLAHARAVAAHQALVRAQIAAAARSHSPVFSPTLAYSSTSHVTSSAQSASLARASTSKPATVTPTHASAAATTVSNSSQNQSSTPRFAATTSDVGDVKNGPLAKAGQELIAIYQEFQQSGTVSSSRASSIYISGNNVKVDVRGIGNVATLAGQLAALGMQVENTDARTGTVEGYVPISRLVDIAQMTQVSSIAPVTKPVPF